MKTALLLVGLMCGLVAASAALSGEFKATPLGPRPVECVHSVPAGANIRSVDGVGVFVHSDEGVKFLREIPECVEDMKSRMALLKAAAEMRAAEKAAAAKAGVTPSPESALGWLDYVTYVPPSTQHLAQFTGYYTVPGSPSATSGDEVLFYFIGTEDINQPSELTILQPVLTWGNGMQGWSYASWNCCPSGQQHESTPIQGFGPGDKLFASIAQTDRSWTVNSAYGGRNTSLTIDDPNRNFDWMDVTLEVYNIEDCSDFAKGPMTFSDMKAVDTQGAAMDLQWQAATTTTQCNGVTKVVDPSTVTITHSQSS